MSDFSRWLSKSGVRPQMCYIYYASESPQCGAHYSDGLVVIVVIVVNFLETDRDSEAIVWYCTEFQVPAEYILSYTREAGSRLGAHHDVTLPRLGPGQPERHNILTTHEIYIGVFSLHCVNDSRASQCPPIQSILRLIFLVARKSRYFLHVILMLLSKGARV
jgi:hypothetical protein